MAQDLTDTMFGQLDGKSFQTYRDFENAVLSVFNRHLAYVPPQYSYRQLIEWGLQNDWIVEGGEGQFRVAYGGERRSPRPRRSVPARPRRRTSR